MLYYWIVEIENNGVSFKEKKKKNDLHRSKTCTLVSLLLSLSWRFEFLSEPLESGRRRSGRGVKNGDGDAVIIPIPTFLDWSGVTDIIFYLLLQPLHTQKKP